MKVKIIFFCILYTQASASFFDEFRGALLSVEDSFGKLVSDVVTDVRDTLDCTILAVKQVLALGDANELSDYNERCKGQSERDSYNVQTTDANYSPTPPLLSATPIPVLTTPSSLSDTSRKSISQIVSKEIHDYVPPLLSTTLPSTLLLPSEKSLSRKLSKEIEKSVVKVENEIMDVIESHDTLKTIEHVKNRIKTETKRLSEIGGLLHRDLSNLTQDVNKVLFNMQSDYIHPSLANIWRDVKVLHDIEIKHINAHDAAEIRKILNEIVSVLRSSDKDSSFSTESNDKDSNKTFSFIENQFELMKLEEEEKSKERETVVDKLFRENVEDASQTKTVKNASRTGFPLTFQDVAKQIIEETKNTYRPSDGTAQKYEEINQTTPKVVTTTVKAIEVENMDQTDYFFSDLIPKDSQSREAAAQEALDIIKSSQRTDQVMAGYFEKSENVGTSVFDDPNLMYFR